MRKMECFVWPNDVVLGMGYGLKRWCFVAKGMHHRVPFIITAIISRLLPMILIWSHARNYNRQWPFSWRNGTISIILIKIICENFPTIPKCRTVGRFATTMSFVLCAKPKIYGIHSTWMFQKSRNSVKRSIGLLPCTDARGVGCAREQENSSYFHHIRRKCHAIASFPFKNNFAANVCVCVCSKSTRLNNFPNA